MDNIHDLNNVSNGRQYVMSHVFLLISLTKFGVILKAESVSGLSTDLSHVGDEKG